jgi:hypothetical protein
MPEYPGGVNPVCPVCGASLKESGTMWFKFEMTPHDNKGNEVQLELPPNTFLCSFLKIYFHGAEMMESPLRKYGGKLLHSSAIRERTTEGFKSQEIVDGVKSNKVSFKFCSIKCMKKFFNDVFDTFVEDFRDQFGYDP